MASTTRNTTSLSAQQHKELFAALKARFEKNMNRHKGLEWPKVQAKLEASAQKLWSLHEMERTGGEPDVVAYDKKRPASTFFMIVRPRVPRIAEACAMTLKR